MTETEKIFAYVNQNFGEYISMVDNFYVWEYKGIRIYLCGCSENDVLLIVTKTDYYTDENLYNKNVTNIDDFRENLWRGILEKLDEE